MSREQTAWISTIDAPTIDPLLANWHQHSPEMGVFALVPESLAGQVQSLQQIFRDAGVPLIGAIFPALIDNGQFEQDGLLLIRLNKMPYYQLCTEIPPDGTELEQAVSALSRELTAALPADTEQSTLFLIFDAMLPHIAQVLEHLYLQIADRVRYMGVNAGSETFQPLPCLFDQERLVQNGLLAVLLPHHQGAALEHGYTAPERFIAATSTEGNRIISIEWRPAFEVYNERVRAQFGVEITRDNFYQYAVHFPFGIIRADGEILVRIPVALQEDGSLYCVGEIPSNAILTLLEAPPVHSTTTTELLANALKTAHQGEGALLSFYCAGRRLHLGIDAAQEELHSLGDRLGEAPLYGALSLGEIGSSRRGGYPLFHNAAVVVTRV